VNGKMHYINTARSHQESFRYAPRSVGDVASRLCDTRFSRLADKKSLIYFGQTHLHAGCPENMLTER
jgi:hypothetical protein